MDKVLGDGWKYGWLDGWINGWVGGWINELVMYCSTLIIIIKTNQSDIKKISAESSILRKLHEPIPAVLNDRAINVNEL